MPRWIDNPAMVRRFCEDKQILEAEIALRIYRFFDQSEPLRRLRAAVSAALTTMIARRVDLVNAAIHDESALGVWARTTSRSVLGLDQLKRDLDNRDNLDATDCQAADPIDRLLDRKGGAGWGGECCVNQGGIPTRRSRI